MNARITIEATAAGVRAYNALREALRETGKVGLVTFVLRNREHVGILLTTGNVLALIQLRYRSEFTKPKVTAPTHTALPEEVKAAKRLIRHMQVSFAPETYHDTYAAHVKKAIVSKVKGQMIQGRNAYAPMLEEQILPALKASLSKRRQK